MQYHERQVELKKIRKRQTKNRRNSRKIKTKKTKSKDVKGDSVEKRKDRMDGTAVHRDLLDLSIQGQNLLPKKVIHITHIKGEEKNLVVLIKFDGAKDPIYVYSKWANEHCPQLVIKYYEKRIRWKSKL